MEVIVKYEPPDYVILLRAETPDDATVLGWFLRQTDPVFIEARRRPDRETPDLKIRKER